MANVDGVQSVKISIALDGSENKISRKWFDAFQIFGLLAYFAVLYSFYAGFFAVLLVIALNVRKDNYFHLNQKLTGYYIADDAYTTPWTWLLNHM